MTLLAERPVRAPGSTTDGVPARAGVLAALRPSDPLAPLAWLVLPLPLWWVLGLANLGYFLAAVPMALVLVRRRNLRVPPGFGWWLLFLLWLGLSVATLPLAPAGTIAEPAVSHLASVAFRLVEYATATVMLLWIVNLDRVLVPARRVVRLLAVLLLWTAAGGLLGAFAPTFELTSLVETLLPRQLTSISYVYQLVHPFAAQIQDVISEGNGRPSAPFAYTNTWGNALGMLLPFGVAAALLARTTTARVGWAVASAVTLVPAILSLNRGLWVALVLSGLFVLGRLLLSGRVLPAAALLAAVAVGGAALLATPLGQVAAERNTAEGGSNSNDVRGFSIERALEISTASPVLGYGNTRVQTGSQSTIGVGKSSACPKCGNIPIGVNGQLWLVIVAQGFLGAFFYVMFHVSLLRRLLRVRDLVVTCCALVTGLTLWFGLVYDKTGPTGCIEFLILGLGARELIRRYDVRYDRSPA